MSELPRGWEALLDGLCDQLLQAGWDGRFAQIKEKFGTLRVYLEEHEPRWEALIEACEDASAKVCAHCGQQGKMSECKGFLLTLCDACHEARTAPSETLRTRKE